MVIFLIIGWIWFICKLIQAGIEDEITRDRVSKTGSEIYRSPNRGLRHAGSGKKLTQAEINSYYMSKRGK
jgi:hypothetical protein